MTIQKEAPKKAHENLFGHVNYHDEIHEDIHADKKVDGYWKKAAKTLLKNKWAMFSLISILFLVVMSLVGPAMTSYTYKDQDVTRAFLPPKIPALADIHWLPFDGYADGVDQYELMGVEEAFWFGTDQFGRDQWTRVWYGTRISLLIAFIASIIDVCVGVTYGGISGYFGGRTDNIMQRIIEVLVGIPNLVIIILAIIVLKPGLLSIIIAIVLTGWVSMARVIRGQVLKLRNMEYVLASKTLGLSNSTILIKDILPNSMAQIIITTMFTIPGAIFFEAFLSFIGLGLPAPMASLGTVINDGFESLQIYPYLVLFPSLIISLLLVNFNLLGDGLRDALDPKMKQ
ncbi:oligopeptide ABC transporter permease [Sporosarcina sp. FSL K6-1522]|uniref:oligopeptide ABC transporter permease n=1 Tax=Sporosarcina sp. FSL K6-1522 TaxID=2921554 RepID=UPI00315AD8E8